MRFVVTAHDKSWDGAVIEGAREVPAGRELHVPVGAKVDLQLRSGTFIALFAAPELGLRDFAAPGLPGDLQFRADREGTFELRGDEMCGQPHTDKTRGRLVVEDAASFSDWLRRSTK